MLLMCSENHREWIVVIVYFSHKIPLNHACVLTMMSLILTTFKDVGNSIMLIKREQGNKEC